MAPIDIEPLKEYLAGCIARVIERKEQLKLEPVDAGLNDILCLINEDVKMALNEMVKSKFLTFHRTINGMSFHFTPPERTVFNR